MRFSIVIPSFNQATFLAEAIDSIRRQGHPGTEIIVIDGGSNDSTVALLQERAEELAYWVSEPDRGQSHALNKGFAVATGDIFAWLCADDYYLDGAFDRVAAAFEGEPEVDFVYGNGHKVNREGSPLAPIDCGPLVRGNLHNYNYIFSTSAFWRRSLWERAGGAIDESNEWTMDWELFARMARHGARFRHLDARLACLRTYPETKTATGIHSRLARNREIYAVSRRHGGPFAYTALIYWLVRIADQHARFARWPEPLHALAFRLLHLPVRSRPRHRKSMLVANPDGR